MSQPAKPQVVFVLGGPGAGKGTQCARIVQDFGFVHLSAGDLLRAERNSGSENGALISSYIKEGKIVPVEITIALIKSAIEASVKKGLHQFLVDGFPRNHDNLQGWDKMMSDFVEVLFVLFFDCPEKVMQARLLERGKTSGRSDDNLESIHKRFTTYQKETMPVIEHFKKLGKVRHVMSTTGPGEVWKVVKKIFMALRPEVVFVLGGPGAGKTTQCANITRDFGYARLSADELIQEVQKTKTELATVIAKYVKEGQDIPVAVRVLVIKAAMEEAVSKGTTQFLIDGFPRNEASTQAWEAAMGRWCKVNFELYLDCPADQMQARLLKRGQATDTAEDIKKRLEAFAQRSTKGANWTITSAVEPAATVYEQVRQLFLPPKPEVVFVLGGPGAGKGTQCAHIVEDYNFVHLSAGDLLRAEKSSGSANGEMISNFIKKGEIVPVEVTLALIRTAMETNMEFGRQRFLIDGFPRNEDNDLGWHKAMDGFANLRFVLVFNCDEKTMEARIMDRGSKAAVRRSDDNPESIAKRFLVFQQKSMPIITKYQALGMVREVDSTQEVQAVRKDVQKLFVAEGF